MRYPLSTLLLIITVFFVLNSCQKEYSIDNGNIIITPPPIIPDSSYLSKIYSIYYDASGRDSSSRTYSYDNLKRVIAMTDSLTDPAATNPFNAFVYYYNGNDTLPYKTRLYVNDFSYTDTTITYHFYNNLGRKIKDSALRSYNTFPIINYYKDTIVSSYSYAPGKIYGITNYSSGSSASASYKDTASVDARGNLLSNKRYRLVAGPPASYELYVTSNITYNNGLSPFAKLSNFKSYIVFPFGETFYNEFAQNNNITQIDEYTIFGPGSVYHYIENFTNYTYNANGYPKEIFTLTPTDSTRLIFKYRAF